MTTRDYQSKTNYSGSGNGSRNGRHQGKSAEYSEEQRNQMIAEAAYYIAEHRHFEGGDPINDWVQAQQEIDIAITHKKTPDVTA